MNDPRNIIGGETLGRLAEESGLAMAILDGEAQQVVVSNNNSICRHLNPGNRLSFACSQYCGKALENAVIAGGMVGFECHAGLDCRAIPCGDANKPFVAIIGRTFLKADNYRKATERAITGDWSAFAPSEFFENVLLTGSSDVLDKTARKAEDLLADSMGGTEISVEPEPVPEIPEIIEPVQPTTRDHVWPWQRSQPEQKKEPEIIRSKSDQHADRSAGAQAWRSFFGSILKTDYAQASVSILEFIAHQYDLSALLWLEKREDRFENTTAFGEMKNRKVRLGISPDDERLVQALQSETSLELGERSKDPTAESKRMMQVFPIGIGDDVSAAVAIIDAITSDDKKKQIARFCHSIAPQLEILRLRAEVSGRDAVANAVRAFGNSLKGIDADDFWQNITQNAAEIMRAERASLLIMDEKSGELEIKALVGATMPEEIDDEVGRRIAKLVYAKNEAVIVSDVSFTGLPPAPTERKYRTSSFLSCPINVGSRTIGVMNFTDRVSGKEFDKESLDLFQTIAPQLAVAVDRTDLKEKAGEFEQLSVTDALTGLLNRRYMEERLLEEIKRSDRHGFPMSFMMLDVDHFKSYNDSHGHPAGDAALKIVAQVIRDTLRSADVAARFGGEEFSILLPQTRAEEAVAIAERIRSNIEHADFPHRLVTTSIGVASCSAELCASADLVAAADKALYEAKREGRNRVRTFEQLNIIHANHN